MAAECFGGDVDGTSVAPNETWGLAIATFERADVLCQSIEYALRQTAPPVEVVICDSSENWESTSCRVKELVARVRPDVRIWYGTSPRAQQTIQRNITVANSTADILFLIDDDSFMREDAAERAMRVYNADKARRIAAVGLGEMSSWPVSVATAADRVPETRRGPLTLVVWVLLASYFFAYPRRGKTTATDGLPEPVKPVIFIEGCRITARREVALKCQFDERMVSNRFEDCDASYRFAQEGALVMLDRPLLFHAAAVNQKAASERKGTVSRFGWIINIAYLNRKFFGGGVYVRMFCWLHWLRVLPVDLVNGILQRNLARLKGDIMVFLPLVKLTLSRQGDIGALVEKETETFLHRMRA